MLAALASFAVMVGVMNLTGYVACGTTATTSSDVFPIISAHIVGMYALVLVVGALIDRIGRQPSLCRGSLLMAVSSSAWSGWRAGPGMSRARSSGSASAGTSPTWRRPRSSSPSRLPRSAAACSASTTSCLEPDRRGARAARRRRARPLGVRPLAVGATVHRAARPWRACSARGALAATIAPRRTVAPPSFVSMKT